jgi:carboxypeptidase PM20D1
MKKAALLLAAIVFLIIGFMFVKAATLTSMQMNVVPVIGYNENIDAAAHRLSEAIRLKTVSEQDQENFRALITLFETSFPKTHQRLTRNIFGEAGLLFMWKGKDETLKPVILMAHTDVVPIDPGSESEWAHPPFSGDIADGFIWGRGTLDCKASVMAILESVEWLIGKGFTPDRTVYLAFGHDEEVSGKKGAGKIAEYLRQHQVKAQWILDEGGMIFCDDTAGIKKPAALVGIAEKGYMTIEISVEAPGGHSSMPPTETAIGILSKAICRLEDNQFPSRYEGVAADMFNYLAPEMPFAGKFFFANTWLFKPVIRIQLQKIPSMNASLRTTIAPTIINAGVKENVLPQKAAAKVNFRLYPGDSIEYVLAHAARVIDDPRVKITKTPDPTTASPVSDIHTESFKMMQKNIHQTFPDVIVAPILTVGGTDTKHYTEISENIFRFLPSRMKNEDMKRIHGANERVGLDNYREMIRFYSGLLKNS